MASNILYFIVFLGILVALAVPLGSYMASVFTGKRTFLSFIIRPLESGFYWICRVDESEEMSWKQYSLAFLLFNAVGFMVLFLLQIVQGRLPLNPMGFGAVRWDTALNTAISFVTNTNWQAYGGETTMSYFTQMAGLTVQNFVSAAVGIAVALPLIRAFTSKLRNTIGNFWVDMTRSVLYVLLPLSIILAVLLVSQGVVQTFNPYVKAQTLDSHGQTPVNRIAQSAERPNEYSPHGGREGKAGYPLAGGALFAEGATPIRGQAQAPVTEQVIAVGPAASQIAIKQLGSNGGGFFNANSAHPFENPTPLSNFLEMLAILLIPAALPFTFGVMVNNRRQGWAIFAAMMILFLVGLGAAFWAEWQGNPILAQSGLGNGTNMEGKEIRFGIGSSVLWGQATTAVANGSVNAMHDSMMPLTGLVFMFNMAIGEVIFGGVGVGLIGMIMYAILTIFLAGLMIGRTPEFLGKKLEAREMIMAVIAVIAPAIASLIFSGIAVAIPTGLSSLNNPGPHGLSEILYAFFSYAGNNGSAFAGLNANTVFYNLTGGFVMLVGRFLTILPALAIAGSLAMKKSVPSSSATFPTASPLFTVLLIGVVLIVGALTFFPALILGPFLEHLLLCSGRTF